MIFRAPLTGREQPLGVGEAEGMLRVEAFVCDEGHEWDQLAEWTDGAWAPLGPGCLKCKEALDAAS